RQRLANATRFSLSRLRREVATGSDLGRQLIWLGRVGIVVVVLLGLGYVGSAQPSSAELRQRPSTDHERPIGDRLPLAAPAALTGFPPPETFPVVSAVPLSESVVGGGHVANDPVAVAPQEIHRGPLRIITGVYQVDLACAGS